VTDFIGFEQNYDKCGFWHYYDCAGNKNFRYLQHAVSYILYKTVGSESIAWYFIYNITHAITAYLLFKVLKGLFGLWRLKNFKYPAFLASLLFLVSPFHSEVLVWRVCIQYSMVSICLLASLLLVMRDIGKKHVKYPLLCLLLFISGLLMLEQVVVMPYMILLLFLFFSIHRKDTSTIRRSVILYFIPQHILIAFYFLASKLVYGKWIMHYGAGVYTGLFSFTTLAKFYNYFFKYLLLVRCWPHKYKELFFTFVERPSAVITLSVLLFFLLFLLFHKFRKGSVFCGLLLFFLVCYLVSLLPVIQLYFTFLHYCANDRLGYISSMFIFTVVVLSLYSLSQRIRQLLLVLLISVNLFFAFKMSHFWKRSTQIYNAYLDSFHNYDAKNVYLLGVPATYQGIWMMLILGQNSGMQEALEYRKKQKYTGKMYDVMQYNAVSFKDGLNAEKTNDSTLYVKFTHNGSWFDHCGTGAVGYENEQYKVKVAEWGYYITFKNYNRDRDVILYPYKLQWRKANL
jgi:hypothetical protein